MSKKTGALTEHLVRSFDGRSIETIGRQDVINMRRRLEKMGYGIAYIGKAHMMLKLMYNKFEAWKSDGWAGGYDFSKLKLPHKNPATMIRKPKDPARDRFITPWEFKRLIKFAKRLNDWDMVDILKMGIWCRLSPIDLKEFNDDEVSENQWQIQLRRRHTIMPNNPEGSIQIIPLKEKMWGLIARRRQFRKEGDKRLLNFCNFKRRFNKLRKLATEEGILPFQLRDFRRSGSGFLWNLGFDVKSIADGNGNTTTITERHYIPKTRPHLNKQVAELVAHFDD